MSRVRKISIIFIIILASIIITFSLFSTQLKSIFVGEVKQEQLTYTPFVEGFANIGDNNYRRIYKDNWKTVDVIEVGNNYIDVTQGDIDANEYDTERYYYDQESVSLIGVKARDNIHIQYKNDILLKYFNTLGSQEYVLESVEILGFLGSGIDGSTFLIQDNSTGEYMTAVLAIANLKNIKEDEDLKLDYDIGDTLKLRGEIFYFSGVKHVVIREVIGYIIRKDQNIN